MNPISIYVYSLFGSWRAECGACHAYGDSYMPGIEKPNGGKGRNTIAEALDSLEKNQHTFNDKHKGCDHKYGSYKPRVTCCINYSDIARIKESYKTDGCERFPRILVDNKYSLEVRNAPKLTHEWSAYSYVKYMQKQEEEQVAHSQQQVDEAQLYKQHWDILQQSTKEFADEMEIATNKHAKYLRYLKYATCFFIVGLLLCAMIYGIQKAGGAGPFLEKLGTACDYKICL